MRPEDLGTAAPLAPTAAGGATDRTIVLAQASPAAGAPSAPAAAPQPMPLPPAEQVTRLKPLPFGGGIEATAYALPDAATFDRIRVVEVDGRLVLALVQPDGSVIVLEGTGPAPGSTTEFEVPNLIVGDVEVPREAIQAAFLGNGIVPAAGEPVSPSSGFNGDEPFPGIGDGLGITPLLPPTDLGFPQFEPRELADDVDLGLNGLFAALAIDDGLPPGETLLLPPSFVSGVIGAGDGPGGPSVPGGEGGPGGPGGGNQANGFMRLDQSAVEGGNRVNAGGVATLTNEVVILAGTNEARLVFGPLGTLATQTDGTGPADLIWRNDPEAPQTRILGYVDRNTDGVPDEGELAIVIELAGTPARPEQTSTYTVTVTLLQGLPDPVPGAGEGGRDTDGFDLGGIPLAIVDGIYTVPGEIDLVVLDDVPILTEGSTGPLIVDEDALSGGNIDTGTPGENNRPDPVTTVTGSLAGLVSVGIDAVTPGSSVPLFSLKPLEGAGPHVLAGVTSQGAPILLAITGSTLTGYVEANASDGYQGGAGADRAIFTLTLTPEGAFTFTLLDQVDHPSLNGLAGDNTENASPLVLDLSGYVTARDSDFDTVTLAPGMLAIQVLDDIPVAVTASTMAFTSVFEDSGYFNVLEIRDTGGATISVAETPGSTATVLMNADSTATGNFALNTGHDSSLARVQIWADNGDGVFDRATDALVGDERLVSALTWNDLAAASAGGTRDLFLAFDDDGASLDGDFNDIVVRVDTDGLATSVVGATVQEDGMSGAGGQAGFPDGSTGNQGPGDGNGVDEAAGGAGSLFALFRVGADEDLTIGLATTLPAGLPRLLSKGEEVSYVLAGGTVTGVAGAGETLREVFTFTVNADGSWAFDLKDQLDHAPGGGENTLLRTADGGTVSGIDLGRLVTGTDADGDTVAAAGGAFVIRVQDDVPVALPPAEGSQTTFTFVAEDSFFVNTLQIRGSGESSGSVGETPGATATVTFDATDSTGGDFLLDTSIDSALARVQIWADDGDGIFNAALDQQIGPDKAVNELSWSDLATASLNGTRDLFLAFDDGGASLDRDFNDLVVRVETERVETAIVAATVEEDGMSGLAGVPGPDGSTGNKDAGDTAAQDEAAGGAGSLNALFRVGADEDLTVGLVSAAPEGLPRLLSQGEVVSYVVTATTVTALAGTGETLREVFSLTVNADGSWTFDLKDQLDHAPGDGENMLLRTADGGTVAGIDLSPFVTGTDRDGDTVAAAAGAFVIHVQDDVPRFAWADAMALHNEAVVSETAGFGFTAGADAPLSDVRFADASGETGLTVGGREVLWQASEDGRQADGYVVLEDNGSIDAGELVFKAQILGDGVFGFDLFQTLDEVDPTKAGTSLAFEIVGTDFDGDEATGSVSVTIANRAPVEGTVASETVTGTALADVIDARDGNDWLYGQDGDDILIGNLGADSAVGGEGADTFKLTDISAQDLIADYETGIDRIDLTALFSTGSDGPASPAELLEYVRYDAGNLSVDADGLGEAHGFVQVAVVDTAGGGAPPPSIQIVYDDQSHQAQTATLNG